MIQNRAAARMGLELQAERMLRSSKQKFTPAKPGDTVRIRVPDVDQGRMDPQNILAVVVAVDNEFYTLGTKESVLNQLYTRNKFAVCKENILTPEEVATDQSVSLRKASTSISQTGGQGYLRCNYKAKYSSFFTKCQHSPKTDCACQHSPVNVYI
ncbi:uncharacterized protein LOC111038638 [Myzus persicae]|uniref:uncharacterized protein LOC111038638 n=1 Tax=Myzus persicae TaxID=13164 RepID=UPI000B930AB3|nr:uncharacterized protein LOC111038638 [Myzus persicae]